MKKEYHHHVSYYMNQETLLNDSHFFCRTSQSRISSCLQGLVWEWWLILRDYRYQFNSSLANEERITNILVKALTAFPSPDFALCLSLLPPHVLHNSSTTHSNPAAGDVPLNESIQKLNALYNLLSAGEYSVFWDKYNGDDLFADLMSDVSDFDGKSSDQRGSSCC